MPRQPRKPRGTALDRVPVYLEVDPATRDKIVAIASALGKSKAAALDLILSHTATDEAACPEWWTGPLASDDQQELPLTG